MKLVKALFLTGLFILNSEIYADSKTTVTPMAVTADGQKIIAYFSTRHNRESKSSDTVDPKGYYRVLLSQSDEGYLVQDFFQANHQAQSSPVLLKSADDFKRFAVETPVGEITLYNRGGQRIEKQIYDEEHNLIYLADYSRQDRMQIEQKYDYQMGIAHSKSWHSNGVLAFELTYAFDLSLLDYKAWLRNGQELKAANCFIDGSVDLENVQLDPCVLQLKSLHEKYNRSSEIQMQ